MDEDPLERAVAQWRDHGWDGGSRLRASLSIVRVEQVIRERATSILRPLGLTYARHELLSLLYFSSQGAMPMGKLSERLFVHPKSVTTTVDGLERDELVERIDNPADRRGKLARITSKGRDLVEVSTPKLAESSFALEALTELEADQLAELLGKVRRDRGDF